jgi:hypothetical protein
MQTPDPAQLPSTRQLLRATAIAATVATLLLVMVVMPAEYGADPSGVGRLLGLKQMGEIKMALAKEAAATPTSMPDSGAKAAPPASAANPAARPATDTSARVTTVTLSPAQAREIKLIMKEGARVTYRWSTDRGVVNYDLHGDTLNAPQGVFHSYKKGAGVAADEGAFVAVFDGRHGWFWRNRGREPLTITLRVKGDYLDLQEIK